MGDGFTFTLTCRRLFSTWTLVPRYALSDSKTVTRFVVFFAEGVPRKWDNAATLVAGFCLYVPLFPFAYPLVQALKFWIGFVKRQNGVRAVEGPSHELAEQEEAAEEEEVPAGLLWCLPLMFIHNVGTLMTLAHSINVVVSLRNEILSEAIAAPVASIVFGIYFLWVSFPAPKERVSREGIMEESFEQRMQNQAFADEEILGVVRSRKFWLSIPLAVVGLAVFALPFVGLYFSQTASYRTLGVILAVVGFALLGLLCCLALKGSFKTIGARLAFLLSVPAVICVGMGLVFHVTRGPSDRNGKMFAGGLLVLLFSVPCGVREYFLSSTAKLQAQEEENQARWREFVEELTAEQEEDPRQAERQQRRQAAEERQAKENERQAGRKKQEAEQHAKRMEMMVHTMEEAMKFPPGLVGNDEASKIEDAASAKQAVEATKAYQASRSAGGEPSTAPVQASTTSVSKASTDTSEPRADMVGDQAPDNAIEASIAAMAAMMEASKTLGETIGDQVPETAMESFMAAMAVITEASSKHADNGKETRDG